MPMGAGATGWVIAHKEFNASDVVLEVGIGGVQASGIFPLDLRNHVVPLGTVKLDILYA